MKLATFLVDGEAAPRAGEVRGAEVVAFADGSTVLDRLGSGDRTPAGGEAFAIDAVSLQAPVTPRAIFGIGPNYADHAEETGATPPEAPIVFMKLPSSSCPPNDPLRVPAVISR